ncbi:hypothetical protein BDV95DRAFT_596797 [Massariosphaeria phaeospora]|uniref:Uncharacterized protein n=1 Tax=Massariosphaeria phaeospora TaxID=100035 RepID=A0A7C8I2H8_9PLEO|nr:hypothetical protein BDV95DRAFT_596797 [Massariosphaeria phaeospora]
MADNSDRLSVLLGRSQDNYKHLKSEMNIVESTVSRLEHAEQAHSQDLGSMEALARAWTEQVDQGRADLGTTLRLVQAANVELQHQIDVLKVDEASAIEEAMTATASSKAQIAKTTEKLRQLEGQITAGDNKLRDQDSQHKEKLRRLEEQITAGNNKLLD